MISRHSFASTAFAAVLAVCGVMSLGTWPALAQAAGADPDEVLLMSFYKDPRPERLVGYLERMQARSELKWNAYVGTTGALAVVFRKHPASIETLVPATLTDKSAEAVSAALVLAGQRSMLQKLQPRLAAAGSDATLKSELAGLPDTLDKLSVKTPTHLDLLWGAAFASGDERYPTRVAEFVAQTANRSEQTAIDIAQAVIVMTRGPGGQGDFMKGLRGKYGDRGMVEIIIAASGLWALASNARNHPFVVSAAEKYVQAHAGTPASKAISALVLSRTQQR